MSEKNFTHLREVTFGIGEIKRPVFAKMKNREIKKRN